VRLLPLFVVGLAVIVLGYAQRAAWDNANMLALLAPQPLRELLLRDQVGITAAPVAVADMFGDRREVRLPRLPTLAEPVVEPVAPTLTAATSAPLPTAVVPQSQVPALPAALVEATPVQSLPAAVPAPTAVAEAAPKVQTLDPVVAVREPMAAHAVQPLYPERALLRGIEGSVRLSYYVDEDGRVRDVRVEQSNPPTVFDSAALTALRKWRFVPGSFEAGSRRYSRLFVFALEGGAPLPAGAALEEATLEAGDCRTITGSRICRRAGDSASAVTEISALN